MKTVSERNIEIVDAINNATTKRAHERNEVYRQGWLDGLKSAGWSDAAIGRLLMEADTEQIRRGIDRPMCGGVWIDWVATEDEEKEIRLMLDKMHAARLRRSIT